MKHPLRKGKYVTVDGALATLESHNEEAGTWEGWVLGQGSVRHMHSWYNDGTSAFHEPQFAIKEAIERITLASSKIRDSQSEVISNSLRTVVEQFNASYKEWAEASGCRANFEWRFDGQGAKFMDIKDIDANIYKKPLPDWVKEK